MPQAPFVVNPIHTAIAIGYRNPEHVLIADGCLPYLPQVVPVEEFTYVVYKLEDGFTVPDMRVGRTGKVPSVEFGSEQKTGRTTDKGLQHPLPKKDLDAAAAQNYDLLGRTTEGLSDLMLLGREQRVAAIMGDSANYASSETVTGTDKWGDAASKPVTQLRDLIHSMLVRPNVLAMGSAEWLKLSANPEVVASIRTSGTSTGVVTREQVASLLEINEILVGEAFVNTSKKGLATTISRAWSGFATLFRRSRMADRKFGMTFGYTVQRGRRQAGSILDSDIGAEGGSWQRVVESNAEQVVASNAGYLIQTPI